MMSLKFNSQITAAVLAIGMICFAAKVDAQGFRIGNLLQAGNGQGFRLGGPHVGMHFGGGQGASFGAGRLGMRFGNGQGARIGGQTYGMQFGGQQGTQIGRFSTIPVVQPGTYYYQDVNGYPVQQAGYPLQQSMYGQPLGGVSTTGVVVAEYPAATPTEADPSDNPIQISETVEPIENEIAVENEIADENEATDENDAGQDVIDVSGS